MHSPLRLTLMSLTAVGVTAGGISTAAGYAVYTTESQSAGGASSGCTLSQPRKLHWPISAIDYVVQPPPPSEVDIVEGEDAVHDSFAAWGAVKGCGQPAFIHGGAASGVAASFQDLGVNENGVYWITSASAWRHGPNVLALTTLTYSTCSGQIVDADIDINAAEFNLSTGDEPNSSQVDVRNTVTHEVGHLLGLDHSSDTASTMYEQAPNAETSKRSLHEDDLKGLCCIYGEGQPVVLPAGVCEGAPADVDASESGLGSGGGETDMGCSAGGAPSSAGACLTLAVSLLALSARRRSR